MSGSRGEGFVSSEDLEYKDKNTRSPAVFLSIRMVPDNSSVSTRGQRVVVVGATAGIGLGIALQFAKTGAEVWIVGRNPKTGKPSSFLHMNA